MPSYKKLKKNPTEVGSVLGSETIMPLGAERSHHLIIGRFPVLGLFLPDFFNNTPLRLRHDQIEYLFKPVAGILPVATVVLLDILPDGSNVLTGDGDGGAVHGGLFELKSV
jgi:hypothetical protein